MQSADVLAYCQPGSAINFRLGTTARQLGCLNVSHGHESGQSLSWADCTIPVKYLGKKPNGSFRVNSTNGSQVTVSNIAQKIPKITLVSIMKACKILGCNSEYFSRYSLSNFLFYYAVLHSRLKWLPLKYHIDYTLYTDRGLKLAILTNWDPIFHILLSE